MLANVGATSQSADIQIVTDLRIPVTGLVAATFPSLIWSRAGANADVAFPALSDLALITTAWAAGGVKERGGGVYRVDLPDAIYSAAGDVKIRGEETNKRAVVDVIEVGKLMPITVTPVSSYIAGRVENTTIEAFYAENGWTIGPVVLTDSDGEPIDLSGYATLRFVVEDSAGTDVLSTTAVTVSGTDSNQWSVVGTSALTGTAPIELPWALRAIGTGLNTVLSKGTMRITRAPNADP